MTKRDYSSIEHEDFLKNFSIIFCKYYSGIEINEELNVKTMGNFAVIYL
jgi:hypothetical protein